MSHCDNCKRDLPEGKKCPVCGSVYPSNDQLSRIMQKQCMLHGLLQPECSYDCVYNQNGVCTCEMEIGRMRNVILEWEKIRGENIAWNTTSDKKDQK